MAKKTTKREPTKEAEDVNLGSQTGIDHEFADRGEMVRTPGDGSRMLSATELEEIHGRDVLTANAREAARIRATRRDG